jgi:hypothetical protein
MGLPGLPMPLKKLSTEIRQIQLYEIGLLLRQSPLPPTRGAAIIRVHQVMNIAIRPGARVLGSPEAEPDVPILGPRLP